MADGVFARHLLRRRIPFAILSISYPTSPQLADDAVQQAISEEGHGTYGVDYCNFGYRVGTTPWLQALARNLNSTVATDWKGRPLGELPMMRGVETFQQNVSLLVDITEPILGPIRRVTGNLIPGLMIDLSPIVAIILIQVLAGLVARAV